MELMLSAWPPLLVSVMVCGMLDVPVWSEPKERLEADSKTEGPLTPCPPGGMLKVREPLICGMVNGELAVCTK